GVIRLIKGETVSRPRDYSISATGFSLSGARLIGDEAWHRRLLATTRLFGLPTWLGDHFAAGGALGNAILLAMMTVPMQAL
ncbi:MAG: hypothetical protein ACI81R_002253, partial [Bradymonadia bacterium]